MGNNSTLRFFKEINSDLKSQVIKTVRIYILFRTKNSIMMCYIRVTHSAPARQQTIQLRLRNFVQILQKM